MIRGLILSLIVTIGFPAMAGLSGAITMLVFPDDMEWMSNRLFYVLSISAMTAASLWFCVFRSWFTPLPPAQATSSET